MNATDLLKAPPATSRGAQAEHRVITLSAQDAWEQGMGAWGVQRNPNEAGIVLYDRLLVEDDGPGIGTDSPLHKNGRSPVFEIGGANRIKKILHVDRPGAMGARLFLRPGARIEFNGRRIEADPGNPYPEIPVALIKIGDNEVVLIGPDDSKMKVKAAAYADILRNAPDRKGRARRSFVSADNGRTWTPFDGEFMVRLHLLQYAPEGNFISPVLDLAKKDDDEEGIAAPGISIQSVSISCDAQTPPGTQVQFMVRTGSAPVFEPAFWSDWQPVQSPARPGHRYLQWKAVLKSSNPTATPVLKAVTAEARVSQPALPAWAERIQPERWENPEIRYTSMPFEYENPQHPKLVALREKYHLDEIVAPAKSELEKLILLRDWLAHQWAWTPPEATYPAWDADEIITGKFGFCVQFAIAYMQCAISLGYQTRFLFSNHPGAPEVGGHEVCEYWSNEFNKWVYMDPADNRHHIHPKTAVPLSMLETHDVLLKTYYGDEMVNPANAPHLDKYDSKVLATCYGTGLIPSWSRLFWVSRMWLALRYMPRNNYYSKPDPAPLRQGNHWDWSEYWIWEGPQMPRQQWQCRHFTGRRSDLEWTINRVRFDAAYGDKTGSLRIQMGTVTPGLESFQVNIDGQGWQPSQSQFNWDLHPGKNRLEMRVRTGVGVHGPVSFAEVEYK